MRGFNNAAFNAKALAVNVSDLEKKVETGAERHLLRQVAFCYNDDARR